MPAPAVIGVAALISRLMAMGATREAAKRAAVEVAKKAAAEARRKEMLKAGVKIVEPGRNTQSASALKAAKEAARAKRLAATYKRQDQVAAQNWNNIRTNRVAKDAMAEVAKRRGLPYPTRAEQVTPEMTKAMNKALNDAKLGFRKVTDLRYPYKKK
jgi:multidrug efflux pump subunit AcrA (membrane-fusion protein)